MYKFLCEVMFFFLGYRSSSGMAESYSNLRLTSSGYVEHDHLESALLPLYFLFITVTD